MGRLGQEMTTLTRRLLGLNPVVAQATNVLGGLAIGSTPMIGVLAGVAAVGFAFDKLTHASREAMAAADKLSVSYNQLAKISALGIGGQQKADLEVINKGLEEHTKWLSRIITLRSMLGSVGGFLRGAQESQADQITAGTTASAAARQQLVNAIGMQQAKDNQARADLLKKMGEPAREAAAKAAAAALQAEKDFWNVQHRIFEDAKDAIAGLREDARQFLLDHPSTFRMEMPEISMPGVSMPLEGLDENQKDQLRQLGILTDHADKNTQMIHDAIWGAGIQSASLIVNALNLGGGGRGSSLGGALGGTAGSVAGMIIGNSIAPGIGAIAGGAIGGLIGQIGGSLLGGLFDHHKKSVDNNTRALEALTSVLNSPAGFKGANYRFEATNAYDAAAQEARRRRARGGANILAAT